MGSRAERWIVYRTENGQTRRLGTLVARSESSALEQARRRFPWQDISVKSS